MPTNNLSVRESTADDFERVINYFHSADEEYLLKMGVDKSKLFEPEHWLQLLNDELNQPAENKKFFFVTWLIDSIPAGHSHINKIIYCEEASMHLHIWEPGKRQKGNGARFVAMSLPFYFTSFKLKRLYCEPYALNPAPNNTLKKAGFNLREQYETTPGPFNFQQPVNKWYMDVEKFKLLYE
jgi:RimJ/RimL family protein N-acetyltransferase